jgi:tetratricopeptide (TPR) repeat protein
MSGKIPYGIVLAAALLLTGCHGEAPQVADSIASVVPHIQVVQLRQAPLGAQTEKIIRQSDGNGATETSPKTKAAPLTVWTPAEKLVPVGSGPGLVVCEPVSVNADASTTDFGAGCGRWLHLTVSGQPALGQTPLWSSLERAQVELGRTDLRLTLPQAKGLASILGVTHVAVGRITGSAAHCTLTYQLWAVPSGRAAVPVLQATGTSTQVLAQLPQLAKRLAAQIGLPNAPLPAVVAAKPADMALLGHLLWYAGTTPTPAETKQMQTLTVRLPLAGLFLVNTNGLLTDQQWDADARALLTQQPDNPLLWAQIAKSAPHLVHDVAARLARNRQAYPKNYLYAVTDAWTQRMFQQTNLERRAAEQSVQDAPRNPDAWLTLGSTISQEGESLRLGRFASDLSAHDWTFLNSVYPQWLHCVYKSVTLDPLFSLAWSRVAEAATFEGQTRLADQAFWKSIALHPNDPEYYAWGLQMYQDKWGGDPGKLNKVAQDLAAMPYPTVAAGLVAVKMLKGNEQVPNQFFGPRQILLTSLLARTQQAIAKNSSDAQAHYDQAVGLDLAGRHSEALVEYKNVALLRPSEVDSHLNLGDAYDKSGMTKEAVAEFRQAVTLAPDSALVLYDLGWDLKHQGQLPEAEAEMRKAIKLSPTYAEAHYGLGEVLMEAHREREATPEYQQAAQLNPFFLDAFNRLCYLLDTQGHYVESLAAGRHAVEISQGNATTMDNMADDYLRLNDWPHSIQMSEAALQADANDALAHENLGEAYIGQGKTADAHDEWNKVLTLDHGALAQTAREMLAKHP